MTAQSPAAHPDSESLVALPEWSVREWLNSAGALKVADLRYRVVVVHAFQMLCPGCVSHGLPQARRVRQAFAQSDVAVVGLHTVFEHHAAMNAEALKAFNQEYRWPFPIGIDEPGVDGPIPRTMRAYGLQGTPSLIVLDRTGYVRLHHLGRIEDMALGGLIGQLLAEQTRAANHIRHEPGASINVGCDGDACVT